MLNDQRALVSSNSGLGFQDQENDEVHIRDIHALTPPRPPSSQRTRRRDASWETGSHRSSNLSMDGASAENFSTMSREFNALVLAGSAIGNSGGGGESDGNNLGRIGEEDTSEVETNPLAIVPDNNPMEVAPRGGGGGGGGEVGHRGEVSVQRVKKEEVESKINAWQNAKIAKVNNRFKREEVVINGWESELVQKATSKMKKVERKLEEKRARALEKMHNEVAKAQRKAEEKRASAEAKRGTKVARILEVANLMKAVGRPPAKRSFF